MVAVIVIVAPDTVAAIKDKGEFISAASAVASDADVSLAVPYDTE
jgi:hypothetical protein